MIAQRVQDSFDEDPGPRRWVLPEEPPPPTTVVVDGRQYRRRDDGWVLVDAVGDFQARRLDWVELLDMGPVDEVLPTSAEQVANRLAALATWLCRHPGLTPPAIVYGSGDLSLHYSATVLDLVAWAEAMGVPAARWMHTMTVTESLMVVGEIQRRRFSVTYSADGLRAWIAANGRELPDDGTVPLDLLRQWGESIESPVDGES